MAKISINLLPQEYLSNEIKQAKFHKVQLLSSAAIVLVAFLATIAVGIRYLQSQNIRAVEAKIVEGEEKVIELAGRQTSLFLIKNRLSTINQYLGITSKQVSTYALLERLLPSRIGISALTVDRSGDAQLVAVVPDILTLDDLISDLTSDSSGKISRVSVESLNRGREDTYRISLKIQTK
ncbi:hypothetical protein HYU96_02250 [Candidatus Daviesbacteria bacterium]|nr:hypothetical protein [Candidatus Daviesbacteria bacterium]